MIRTIARVIRSEGAGSAARRARERMAETWRIRGMLARGASGKPHPANLLNVSAAGPFARLGGLPAQLMARLEEERRLRDVAFLYPGILETGARAHRMPGFTAGNTFFDRNFEHAVGQALMATGAAAIHIEGTAGFPIGSILRLADRGLGILVSLHDFSTFCARPHLVEEPSGVFCNYSTDPDRCRRCLQQERASEPDEQPERRRLSRELLQRARAVIFPSAFLYRQHQSLFALPDLAAAVIEPAVKGETAKRKDGANRLRVAYAGSVKPHKGARLMLEIIAALKDAPIDWHIFGGGDEELLHALRRLPNTSVHGYYRGGSLPRLLAHHGIDLAILPSIWPETYCFTLSECWLAGVPAVAFDHGAIAERIARDDGGWLAPLSAGAPGIVSIIRRWREGELTTTVPAITRMPADAAREHLAIYRSLSLID